MQQTLSLIAIALTFAGFAPYIYSILKGKTKPHVFSWIIWGVTTTVVYAAQVADGGGVGAWSTGVSGLITFGMAVLAYVYKSDFHITRTDWAFFVLALGSVPLWYLTSSPLSAVLLLTAIDTLGFAPTYRKAWALPWEEQITFYALFVIRNLFQMAALENLSVTTLLFPVVTGIGCIPLIAIIRLRRRAP